jgi:hypothetical protein
MENSRKSRATKRGRKNNCISSIWKMRLPNLQKLDFASKIWKTHGNLGCQESRTKICIHIYISLSSIWKHALAQPPKS